MRFESTDDLQRHAAALAQISALSRAAERSVGPVSVPVRPSVRSKHVEAREWPSSLAFALWADYSSQVEAIAAARAQARRRQLALDPPPRQAGEFDIDVVELRERAAGYSELWAAPAWQREGVDVQALQAGNLLEELTARWPALWTDQLLDLAAEGRVDPRRVRWPKAVSTEGRFAAERIYMESPLEVALAIAIVAPAALVKFGVFVKSLRWLNSQVRGLQIDHLEFNNAAARLRVERLEIKAAERQALRGLDDAAPSDPAPAQGQLAGGAPLLAEARVSIEDRSGGPGPADR